jgi:hypothetical protein
LGLGFGVWGLGFRVWGLGFSLGCRVSGLGFRVGLGAVSGLRVEGWGLRVEGVGVRPHWRATRRRADFCQGVFERCVLEAPCRPVGCGLWGSGVYGWGVLLGKDCQGVFGRRVLEGPARPVGCGLWGLHIPQVARGVLQDPPQVRGSYVCPTVGAYWLLATYGIGV